MRSNGEANTHRPGPRRAARLRARIEAHRGLLSWYERMAPMQDKIFKYVQHELDDINEAERWKVPDEDDDDDKEKDDYV